MLFILTLWHIINFRVQRGGSGSERLSHWPNDTARLGFQTRSVHPCPAFVPFASLHTWFSFGGIEHLFSKPRRWGGQTQQRRSRFRNPECEGPCWA